MKQSTNYDEFTFVRNREISQKHVNKLIKANKEQFLLDAYPIIVNEKKQIFDGQHRYLACRALGKPIYFIEKDIRITANTLIKTNSVSKVHTTKDKIDIALAYGKKEFIKARDVHSIDPRVPREVAFELLHSWTNGGGFLKTLNAGKFKVTHVARYKQLVSFLTKVTLPQEVKFTAAFIHAVAFYLKHKPELLTKLLLHPELVTPCNSRIAYRAQFDLILSEA